MSYDVLYEITSGGRITTCAEPATASANLALAALRKRTDAGLTAWIRCSNGQVLTAASLA
jgi:hypothetical protein